MYDKDVDGNYEQWEFLEKFNGWNSEFSKEIVKVAEEQEINLRKVFGKAISNMLKNGTETKQIVQYATDCFSIGQVSGNKNLQFLGVEHPVSSWCKAYIVELDGEFWEIKFAVYPTEGGQPILGYSKAVLNRSSVEFDENGKVKSWHTPKNSQLVLIEPLRGTYRFIRKL